MNCKVVKKLGVGWTGTVYLVEINGRRAVQKIEKLEVPPEPNLQNEYYRQVAFNDWAAAHPLRFLTLISHGIMHGCSHVQPIPAQAKHEVRNLLVRKNKLSTCIQLTYTPVLYYTLEDRPLYSSPRYLQNLYHLIETINIMRKAGFMHNDVHSRNIMFDKVGRHPRLIDYGALTHIDWPLNETDIFHEKWRSNDLLKLLLTNDTIEDPATTYANKNGIKLINYTVFINRVTASGFKARSLPNQHQISTKIQQRERRPLIAKNIREETLTLQLLLVDYDLYMDCMGFKGARFDQFRGRPANQHAKLFLYILRHATDANYDKILTRIKAAM